MKIGSGWTKSNETDGSTFISFSLDKVILELFPQLQNCNLTASYVKESDRKQENSPSWSLSISKKTDKKEKSAEKAEKEIIQEAAPDKETEAAANDLIEEEDIPL